MHWASLCAMSPTVLRSLSVSCCCSLCADARDSIAKVAYGRVFGWIVCKINELLAENVDPEVELREIGEFCLPCSCSILKCASLSLGEGQGTAWGFTELACWDALSKQWSWWRWVSSVKSIGFCSALSSQLIWSNCEAIVLGHSGLAEKPSWSGSSFN